MFKYPLNLGNWNSLLFQYLSLFALHSLRSFFFQKEYTMKGKNLDLWRRLAANGFFSMKSSIYIAHFLWILHRQLKEFPYASNNFTWI